MATTKEIAVNPAPQQMFPIFHASPNPPGWTQKFKTKMTLTGLVRILAKKCLHRTVSEDTALVEWADGFGREKLQEFIENPQIEARNVPDINSYVTGTALMIELMRNFFDEVPRALNEDEKGLIKAAYEKARKKPGESTKGAAPPATPEQKRLLGMLPAPPTTGMKAVNLVLNQTKLSNMAVYSCGVRPFDLWCAVYSKTDWWEADFKPIYNAICAHTESSELDMRNPFINAALFGKTMETLAKDRLVQKNFAAWAREQAKIVADEAAGQLGDAGKEALGLELAALEEKLVATASKKEPAAAAKKPRASVSSRDAQAEATMETKMIAAGRQYTAFIAKVKALKSAVIAAAAPVEEPPVAAAEEKVTEVTVEDAEKALEEEEPTEVAKADTSVTLPAVEKTELHPPPIVSIPEVTVPVTGAGLPVSMELAQVKPPAIPPHTPRKQEVARPPISPDTPAIPEQAPVKVVTPLPATPVKSATPPLPTPEQQPPKAATPPPPVAPPAAALPPPVVEVPVVPVVEPPKPSTLIFTPVGKPEVQPPQTPPESLTPLPTLPSTPHYSPAASTPPQSPSSQSVTGEFEAALQIPPTPGMPGEILKTPVKPPFTVTPVRLPPATPVKPEYTGVQPAIPFNVAKASPEAPTPMTMTLPSTVQSPTLSVGGPSVSLIQPPPPQQQQPAAATPAPAPVPGVGAPAAQALPPIASLTPPQTPPSPIPVVRRPRRRRLATPPSTPDITHITPLPGTPAKEVQLPSSTADQPVLPPQEEEPFEEKPAERWEEVEPVATALDQPAAVASPVPSTPKVEPPTPVVVMHTPRPSEGQVILPPPPPPVEKKEETAAAAAPLPEAEIEAVELSELLRRDGPFIGMDASRIVSTAMQQIHEEGFVTDNFTASGKTGSQIAAMGLAVYHPDRNLYTFRLDLCSMGNPPSGTATRFEGATTYAKILGFDVLQNAVVVLGYAIMSDTEARPCVDTYQLIDRMVTPTEHVGILGLRSRGMLPIVKLPTNKIETHTETFKYPRAVCKQLVNVTYVWLPDEPSRIYALGTRNQCSIYNLNRTTSAVCVTGAGYYTVTKRPTTATLSYYSWLDVPAQTEELPIDNLGQYVTATLESIHGESVLVTLAGTAVVTYYSYTFGDKVLTFLGRTTPLPEGGHCVAVPVEMTPVSAVQDAIMCTYSNVETEQGKRQTRIRFVSERALECDHVVAGLDMDMDCMQYGASCITRGVKRLIYPGNPALKERVFTKTCGNLSYIAYTAYSPHNQFYKTNGYLAVVATDQQHGAATPYHFHQGPFICSNPAYVVDIKPKYATALSLLGPVFSRNRLFSVVLQSDSPSAMPSDPVFGARLPNSQVSDLPFTRVTGLTVGIFNMPTMRILRQAVCNPPEEKGMQIYEIVDLSKRACSACNPAGTLDTLLKPYLLSMATKTREPATWLQALANKLKGVGAEVGPAAPKLDYVGSVITVFSTPSVSVRQAELEVDTKTLETLGTQNPDPNAFWMAIPKDDAVYIVAVTAEGLPTMDRLRMYVPKMDDFAHAGLDVRISFSS